MIARKDGTLKCPNLWSYRNAFFFTGTIGTTIGYGNVYPTTSGGKIFCVLYALTSIPLFGFFMGKIGDTLKLYMGKVLVSLYGHSPSKRQAFTILMAYVVLGSIVFSIIPAICFHFLEGWILGIKYFTLLINFDMVRSYRSGDNLACTKHLVLQSTYAFVYAESMDCAKTILSPLRYIVCF